MLFWFVSKADLSTINTSSSLGRTECGLSTLYRGFWDLFRYFKTHLWLFKEGINYWSLWIILPASESNICFSSKWSPQVYVADRILIMHILWKLTKAFLVYVSGTFSKLFASYGLKRTYSLNAYDSILNSFQGIFKKMNVLVSLKST